MWQKIVKSDTSIMNTNTLVHKFDNGLVWVVKKRELYSTRM